MLGFVNWGPFLEGPANLPGPISVFGHRKEIRVLKFLLNRSQFLLALNT